MDESTVPIGVPCMAEAQVGARHFFFVRVSVQTDSQPKQRIAHQVSQSEDIASAFVMRPGDYLCLIAWFSQRVFCLPSFSTPVMQVEMVACQSTMICM